MTDRYTTDEAGPNTDWTRRSFMSALGGTGLLASTSTASAETTGCCCCDGAVSGGADIDTEALDAVIARLNAAADMLEFPARRVGSVPRGTQHSASRWGIHFRSERDLHLGRATVDAGEAGSFTAVLGTYDGENAFEPVHERSIEVEAGVNEIDLDMTVEPGEYLLTREGDFPLRRGEWNGWESQSRDGLELIGGSKPGDFTKPNRYWYYFFDLNVAAHEDAHL